MSQRKRPANDMPEKQMLDSLDEIEQAAKNRISKGQRAPLTGTMNLEWTDQEEGYHYYWHSDSDLYTTTFSDLLNNGYEFVRRSYGMDKGQKVVKKRGGATMYLMRVPDEIHQENMNREAEAIARKEIDLNNVGSREYAGDSKELGKGTAVKADYTKESPLMMGNQS